MNLRSEFGYSSTIVGGAEKCLDEFTERFNARDPAGMDEFLHFPHVLVSGTNISVWQSPGQLPTDFFDGLAASGWESSVYEARDPILVSSDKVHFLVRFARLGRQGTVLTSQQAVWIVTRIAGRWGIAVRSY